MSSEAINKKVFSHSSDLKNRIFFTIIILSIYRLGTYVPLSGIDPFALQEAMASSQKVLWACLTFFPEVQLREWQFLL